MAKITIFPSVEQISLRPWKYIGWAGFAQFAAKDDDFLVLRRFDESSIRVLLAMQDHIAQLEEDLRRVDAETSDVHAVDVNNGTFRQDPRPERKTLLEQLKLALLEYKQFIWLHSELKKRPSADIRSRRNIEAWLYNHNGAIIETELGFISSNDLINITSRTRSPLKRLLENLKVFRLPGAFRTQPVEDPHTVNAVTYSDTRLDNVVHVLQLIVGVGMLIGPLWILNSVQDKHFRLVTISCSIVLFLGLVSVLTSSRVPEALAATAAYSAVLMVFMQIQA